MVSQVVPFYNAARAGAVRLGMRGEDALAQGGARARHADYEHGLGIAVGRARAVGEALAGEARYVGLNRG